MSGTVCLANANLVLQDRVLRGYVTVEDGVITEIGEGARVPDGGVDCHSDHVVPGLVELHTDNLERHIEPRPEVHWPLPAAIIAHDAELASTGITTVFDALRVGSIVSRDVRYGAYARKLATELLRARAAGVLRISHFLHLRAEVCSETLTTELAEFGPADRVGIVSLMDHTPGQRQFRDLDALKVYLGKKRNMNDDAFREHVAAQQALHARVGVQHEAAAVAEAARYGAVLASHDDTTAAQVVTSHTHGVQIAEFPTTVEAAAACREHGIHIMMGAPNIIRGASHSGNVSARELAEADLLDIVSSDYVPAALLLSAFRLADLWQDVPRAINCVSRNPAVATGLLDRGRIAVGCRGDLLHVAVHEGTPRVRSTWSRGTRV